MLQVDIPEVPTPFDTETFRAILSRVQGETLRLHPCLRPPAKKTCPGELIASGFVYDHAGGDTAFGFAFSDIHEEQSRHAILSHALFHDARLRDMRALLALLHGAMPALRWPGRFLVSLEIEAAGLQLNINNYNVLTGPGTAEEITRRLAAHARALAPLPAWNLRDIFVIGHLHIAANSAADALLIHETLAPNASSTPRGAPTRLAA